MSIGIEAANLATEGFELDIPGAEGDGIRVVLGQSGGLTGRYEQDGRRISLRQIAAHQISVRALVLPLAGGTLRVDGPSVLGGLRIDAALGGEHPFVGQVTSANASAHVVFERGPLVVRAGLSLSGLASEHGGAGGARVELESVAIDALRVDLSGAASVVVEQLTLHGVRCRLEPSGELSLACASAHAQSLLVEQGGRSLRLGRVEFPKGVALEGDVLRWTELTLQRLDVDVPELAPRRSAAAASTRSAALELPWLDHLQGRLAFDLMLDVRIPILPDRRATHSIRVPITQGHIDFKQLEGCLARLENTLFDFEVNDEGLILELDPIPGVKLDNVTLVTWPLAGHEHVLARTRQLIRLQRLLEYRLSPKLASGQAGPRAVSNEPSALRRLHVGNIDTVLAIGGPVVQPLPGFGSLRLGAPGVPAVAELRLGGQLEHAPDQPASTTELRLDGRELMLAASIADGQGRRVEVERVDIARVDALRVGLLGLEPRSVGLSAQGIRCGGVELRGLRRGAPAA